MLDSEDAHVAQAQMLFEIDLTNAADADEIEAALKEAGATDIQRVESPEDFIELVIIGAILAGAGIAEVVNKIRVSRGCQQIITFHKGKLRVRNDCRHRNGQIIVIADAGMQVVITKMPQVLDLTKVATAALTAGADAAKAVVESHGGAATIEKADG